MKWLIEKIRRICLRLIGKIVIENFVDAEEKITAVDSEEVFLVRSDAYNIGIVFKDGSFNSFPINKASNWDSYQKLSSVAPDPFIKNVSASTLVVGKK